MSPRKLIGARDPYGFRPLCIGKRDNAYILTSESCALDTLGATFVRDVLPGEIVTITPGKGDYIGYQHVYFQRRACQMCVRIYLFCPA